MGDFHYRDNANLRKTRRRRLRLLLASASLAVFGIAVYIIYDALSASTVVVETPPVTSTLGQQTEQAVFDNDYFRLTTSGNWREAPPLDDFPLNFRFQGFEDDLVRQDLTVYVNTVPDDLALTHVLPVESDGSKIVPLSVSPKCSELQPNKNNKRDTTLSWAGVSFLCDPDLNAYIVGTSNARQGHAFSLGGNRFFFVYRDLRAAGQLDDFPRLLKGFEAK